MILIGLTGGIASGKSTVARLLEARGALIVDADLIAREVLEVGTPAYSRVVERFGDLILAGDFSIDRERLAEVVFADAGARSDLEQITHPEIYREISKRIDAERGEDRLVVVDAALLVETLPERGRSLGLDALVVVAANPDDQISRLVRDRQMSDDESRARMAAQAPQERKLAAADYVIDNRGGLEALEKSVDSLWKDLQTRFGG